MHLKIREMSRFSRDQAYSCLLPLHEISCEFQMVLTLSAKCLDYNFQVDIIESRDLFSVIFGADLTQGTSADFRARVGSMLA